MTDYTKLTLTELEAEQAALEHAIAERKQGVEVAA